MVGLFRRLLGGVRRRKRSPSNLLFEEVARIESPEEGDRAVVDQLRGLGAETERPRQTDHYLYFPHREAASTAAARLRKDGYQVRVSRSASGESWLVLASHDLVVNDENIERVRGELDKLARALGGEYDGWETAAKP